MTIRLLKDLDFANKLSLAEPVTESALDMMKRYRGYMYTNAATCTLVNNFIREARQYGYDRGVSKILEAVESFINENKISWKLATACEAIQGNNSTYSYIAKLGVGKVEQLLEMNENDVVSYIKAGALRSVKYIPEFREVCKDVYRSQVNESMQTVKYSMSTPFCYTITEGADSQYISILGKTLKVSESKVEEAVCDDPVFNKINAHLQGFQLVGENIEYNNNGFNYSIGEGKLTLSKNGTQLEVFENSSDFLKYCDTMSRIMPGMQARNFMTINGAIAEVFEAQDGIVMLDNSRVFRAANGTTAFVVEAKDNVYSFANGNGASSEFMVEALKNIEDNCGVDVKVVYEARITDDLKKGNPEEYANIQEELEQTKSAKAELRYRKIEQLAESMKDNPAAIAVLNSITRELRMLDE